MPVESERKFLVEVAALPRRLPEGERLEQGYLSTEPVVRVRIITRGKRRRALLTVKGSGLRRRAEYEYAVPVDDARRMLQLCGERTLGKIRRRIGGWEVDQFLGRHAGLWMAEYELYGQRGRLPALPAWVGREVTQDPRFTNARLSLGEVPPRKRRVSQGPT
jgi:CYTH domain-containing protein